MVGVLSSVIEALSAALGSEPAFEFEFALEHAVRVLRARVAVRSRDVSFFIILSPFICDLGYLLGLLVNDFACNQLADCWYLIQLRCHLKECWLTWLK